MKNLFAYGTLMCKDIFEEITGYEISSVDAVLYGYKRLCVKNACYPAIIQCRESVVKGKIYFNLSDESWDRLDDYEGDMYERKTVTVYLNDKTEVTAYAYICKHNFIENLNNKKWNFRDFLKKKILQSKI